MPHLFKAMIVLTILSVSAPAMAKPKHFTGFVPAVKSVISTKTPSLRTAALENAVNITKSGKLIVSGGDKNLKIGGLLPKIAQYTYVYDANVAAALNIVSVSAEYAKNKSLIIQEFSMSRTNLDGTKRLGIGIRLYILVNKRSGKLGISGFPSIAASIQAGEFEGQASLEVIGIQGKKINAALPSLPAELTFGTFKDMYNAFDAIRDLIFDNDTILTVMELGEIKSVNIPD